MNPWIRARRERLALVSAGALLVLVAGLATGHPVHAVEHSTGSEAAPEVASDARHVPGADEGKEAGLEAEGAVGVRIVKHGGLYRIDVDGEPFVVRGAGLEGRDAAQVERLAEALADAGGTAFRTWDPAQAEVALAAARRHGLRVLVGLGVVTELGGFDYADEAAVARQHAAVTAFVDRHRSHPNVLGWVVANEPNLSFGADGAPRVADPRVYEAIARIVEHVQAGSPRHPATVAFAFTPTITEDIRTALEALPTLDFISLQGYGALPAIPEVATEAAPELPFMVTEFGALGHWEMPKTDWGREIEEPSGPKAVGVVARMSPAVTDDQTGRLLGAFAFLWGQKQERTPTWYGLFVDDMDDARAVDAGDAPAVSVDDDRTTSSRRPMARIATVDELTRIWTGQYPSNRAPRALSITLDARLPTDSVRLAPGAEVRARVSLEDADDDPLDTRWILRREVLRRSDGGMLEVTPPAIDIRVFEAVPRATEATLVFKVPTAPGEYRLFAYSRDGHGGVATANIPFRVEAP